MESKRTPYALLVNDIHVSKDNINEFKDNWDEALRICRQRDIPEIIIGGDLWMSRSAQVLPTLMAVRTALIKAASEEVAVTIACGNHDKVDQESLDSYNHVFHEYAMVDVIDDYAIYDISDDATLYVMSYFPENGSFVERYKDMIKDLDCEKTNVLYIHEGIRGGLAQPSDDELPASLFEDFDSVLVGHYHDRKAIPGTNIMYIGASRQHNFGEDEEKGYTILFDNGSTEFVKNMVNTRYATIETSIADLDNKLLAQLQTYEDCGYNNKIRLKIYCKAAQVATVDRQKLLEAGVSKIEFVTEDTVAQQLNSVKSIDTKFDKSGIKAEYRNFCHDKDIADVDMGLQYLDKIQ